MGETVVPAVVVATASKDPAAITLAGYGMIGLGIILIVMLWWIFFKAQGDRRNKVDFTDLLLDSTIGKMTQGKFWGLVGGAAGTWVFIFLPVSGHFDATYASAYLVAVFALKVAGDITNKPPSNDQPEPMSRPVTREKPK